MPTRRPAARPDTSRGALSLVMKTAGRNSLESNESARDTAITKNGAVRSATAYQRPPTRQLSNRASTSRSPAQPETRLVIRRPARLGPASIATYMAGPIVDEVLNGGRDPAWADDEQDAGPRDGKREGEVGSHRVPGDERLNGRHDVLLPFAHARLPPVPATSRGTYPLLIGPASADSCAPRRLSRASSSRHDPDPSGPHGSGFRAPAKDEAQNGPSRRLENHGVKVWRVRSQLDVRTDSAGLPASSARRP